jgi:MtN3 and saliva related transmembrane protein
MSLTTVIGLLAACCTTIAFLPQAIKAIRTKHTRDLSLVMYSLFTSGVLLWLIYGILRNDCPVIIANAVTLLFAATILFLKIRYK